MAVRNRVCGPTQCGITALTPRCTKGGCKLDDGQRMPGAGLSCRRSRKAPLGKPTFQPYWGKPAVRNDREDRGNVGIIRSPLRASILPDSAPGWGRKCMASTRRTTSLSILMPKSVIALLSNAATTELWIAALHLDDGRDELCGRAFRSGLSLPMGRGDQQTVFSMDQRPVEFEQRGRLDNRG